MATTYRNGSPRYDATKRATVWEPVAGPHLRRVRQHQANSRTGVVGISYYSGRTPTRADGTSSPRHYFVAECSAPKRFCIETLGRQEAWRRAVTARAEFESKRNRINAAIQAARALA